MRFCPNCNKEYEYKDDDKFCPVCGSIFIEKPSVGGMCLDLGDANAINGGVHLQDSHDAYNIRNTSNTVNDNSTTTNVVYEAQKSADQIHAENINVFLAEVVRLIDSTEGTNENGMLSAEAFHHLTLLRLKLMLSQQEAESIIVQVQQSKMQMDQALQQRSAIEKQSQMAQQMKAMAPPIPEMPLCNPQSVQLNQMQGFNPLQAAQQMGLGVAGMQMPQMLLVPSIDNNK